MNHSPHNQLVWRVVGWDARFETRGSLRKRGPRGEIAVSTDLDADKTRRLLDAPAGFLAFGLWNLICRIAATSARRGVLVQDGQPLTAADLARLARFPLVLLQPALKLLESPEIGLLERVPLDQALLPAITLAPLRRKPRIQPLRQCPVCSADLTEYYQLEVPPQKASVVEGQIKPVTAVSAPPQKLPVLPPRSVPIREFAITSPHPSWNKLPWIHKSTEREFEEMHVRYFLHEITRAELDQFLDTHYYDEDDPDNEDWDDEDNELQTDIPPPQ